MILSLRPPPLLLVFSIDLLEEEIIFFFIPGSDREVVADLVSRNGMKVFLGERRGPLGEARLHGDAVSFRSLLARNCLRAVFPGT